MFERHIIDQVWEQIRLNSSESGMQNLSAILNKAPCFG